MTQRRDGAELALDGLDIRPLLEAVADGLVLADASGRIVAANAAAERLLGWPSGALVGRELEAILPGRPPEGGDAARVVARRFDGSEIAIEAHLRRAAIGGGAVVVATLRGAGAGAAGGASQAHRFLRATTRAAATFGTRLDADQLAATVVEALAADFDAALACLWLMDDEAGALRLRAAAGPARDGPTGHLACKDPAVPPGPVASAVRDGAVVVRRGLADDPDFDRAWAAREAIAAAAVLPLKCGGQLCGAIVYYSRQAVPEDVLDALGAFAAIVGAALNDVQMLAREQAARVESEEQRQRLQTVLDMLPVGVALVEGPEGRLTMINPAARAIWGEIEEGCPTGDFDRLFPLSTMEGQPIAAEDRPLALALRRGERSRQLVRFRRGDGAEFVLDVSTAPFPGPRGGAVSTYRDVTTQLRMESERAERGAQFKALLDHLPVGVAYFDVVGVCRACNGPAHRILGRSRSEITGATADELFAQAEELRDGLLRCVRDQVPHARERVPWPDPAGGPEPRFLDWRFEPLPSDPAKPRGALALIVDVTDRTHFEAQLQRAAAAAEQASRNKTQFLSAVSHDLRTPVNALSLQAELLARVVEGRDDAEGELGQLAGDIRQAASNLIELINDLLDLTRFDSGGIEHHPTTFALDPWLEATLAPLEAMARDKGLAFSWRVDRPGRTLRADRVKLGRVLVNLAGNAVKFTERGEVEVAVGAIDGWLALAVRDTGPGIPEDQQERIFDEFAQLRNPERDRTKGTGLGLAICRRLVEAVGGRLTVESRPGRGSTFTALYPPGHLVASAAPPPAADGSAGVRAVTEAPILLVEDDPHSRKALARLLAHAGYAVADAADGPGALAALDQVRPALILLDLMLPGMDGAEVLRRIRAHPSGGDVPVVVLSGDVMGRRTSEMRAMDVAGMLAKPVDFDELLEVVARHASSPQVAG
jgi:PAS domain S-box-containing protein